MTASSDPIPSYTAGDLMRFAAYEWVADATPAAVRPWPSKGPWLVAAPREPLLIGGNRPPWGRGLLRQFSALKEQASMAAFAGKYGFLGEPVALRLPDGHTVHGESLELWEQEVSEVGGLAAAIDHAAVAEAQPVYRPAREALSNHFAKEPDGDRVDQLVFRYGSGSMEVTFGMVGRYDPAELERICLGIERITNAGEQAKSVRALALRARGCVQWAIQRRLQDAHVGIRYANYHPPASQPPLLVPSTLLGAIYPELDRKLRTPLSRRAPRPRVACAWGPCPNWVEPVRVTGSNYCGNTCRKRASRQKRRQDRQVEGRP